MSDIKVLNFKDINTQDFSFGEPKKTQGGSYISDAYYLGKSQRLFIQFPKIKTISSILNNQLSLEITKDKWELFEFLTSLDSHCIKYIYEHSVNWFSESFTYDMVDDSYKNVIKITDTKCLPSFRFKMLSNKNEKAVIFNNKKEPQENILENSYVVILAEFQGLRFMRTNVKPEWRIVQVKMFENVGKKLTDYLINDEYLSDNDESLELSENNNESIENNNESIKKSHELSENTDEFIENSKDKFNNDSDEESVEELNIQLNISNDIDEDYKNTIEII